MHGDNWLATCANYSQLVSTTGNRSCTLCHSLSHALRRQITSWWGRLNSNLNTNDRMQHHRLYLWTIIYGSRGRCRISEGGGGGVLTIIGWLRKVKLVTSSYSVQSTLSMPNMLSTRGVWGHAPTEKFCKLAYSVLQFGNILTEK